MTIELSGTPSEQKRILNNFVRVIPGVTGTNLTKAFCEEHKEILYFERVEGDIFKCANIAHRDEEIFVDLKSS